MTKKHTEAQALLDAMEQVDEGMLQQAYITDTPEKFRALGRVKTTKIQKERPVTALRRWTAVAACLAFAIALACLPWVFSGLLPMLDDPSISQQTQPTQTTVPTEPTVPSTPTLPNTQIRLNKSMEIWYHSDAVHLFCTYIVNSDVVYPGQTISVTLYVENAGAAIAYTGAFEDQFGTAQLRSDSDSNYTITSVERPTTDDATAQEFAHLEAGSYTYQFVIPQDAPEDSYTLEIDAFGEQIRFNAKATLRPQYVPCLADLPEEAQKIVARTDYGVEGQYYSYSRHAKGTPIYGEFGNVIVAFWQTWGNAMVTYETVNGLQFKYGSTARIEVFTPDGVFTLTEAFESGLLTAEQLQQVHDNWKAVGRGIEDNEYDPRMRISSMRLTHWGEMRWAYVCKPEYGSYFAGEQVRITVEITNYGPDTSDFSILNEIGENAQLISTQTGYTLESITKKIYGIGYVNDIWTTGGRFQVVYTFTVPEDFDEGQYTFVFTVGDEEVRFDKQSAEKERNITIVSFMDLYEGTLFFGENYWNDPEFQKNQHMPVYGQFAGNRDGQWYGASVFIYPTESTDGENTILTINGLEFDVPDGYQLHVSSGVYGSFTLAEAFEAGIITEEMLQEVYDNYIFLQNSSSSIVP